MPNLPSKGSSSRVGNKIRQLRAGEPVPSSTPKRYRNASGYIRLRWKVGFKEYVEAYEHRVVAGVVGLAVHVHHKNRDKRDNAPDNLQPMEAKAHGVHHKKPTWDVAEAMRLYGEGWSTTRMADRYGVNSATIFRVLTLRGFQFDRGKQRRVPVDVDEIVRLRNRGHSVSAIARALNVSRDVVRFRLRDFGGPSGAHAPTTDRMV